MHDLETSRLRMRAFEQSDLDAAAYWEGRAHAEKFLEFCFQSYREWGMGPWALVIKVDGLIAGNCGFCRISYDRAGAELELCGEVNYYVGPQHRLQGFASEALLAVVKFGFDGLRLTRIQGRCDPKNVASERVLQKAGMRLDRTIGSSQADAPEQRLYAITLEQFHMPG